jgi:hypothetical protein
VKSLPHPIHFHHPKHFLINTLAPKHVWDTGFWRRVSYIVLHTQIKKKIFFTCHERNYSKILDSINIINKYILFIATEHTIKISSAFIILITCALIILISHVSLHEHIIS